MICPVAVAHDDREVVRRMARVGTAMTSPAAVGALRREGPHAVGCQASGSGETTAAIASAGSRAWRRRYPMRGRFRRAGEDAAMRKMREAAVVVDMQVGQHDRFHVAGADAELRNCGPDFLLRLDVEADGKLEIRMPARQRFQMRRRSGIDDDDALRMLDRPGVDRRPVRPFARDDRLDLPPRPVAAAFDLRLFDLTRPVWIA